MSELNLNEEANDQEDFPELVCLDDVVEESVEFLSEPYIPLGKLTVKDGDPGVSKSTLTLKLAADLSRGRTLPGNEEGLVGKTLIFSTEDGLADTIKPRLRAMDADFNRVFAVDKPFTLDDDGFDLLEAYIKEVEPLLVVIDPLFAYFGAERNPYKSNETRPVMSRMAKLAEKFHCAIVIIRHLTKSAMMQAIYRGQGNIDILAACRSALLVGRDPQNPSRGAVFHTKCNVGPLGDPIGFKVVGNGIEWTETTLTVDQVLAPEQKARRSALAEAKEFLRSLLADEPVLATEVFSAAQNCGISLSSLKRAKKELRIKSQRSEFGTRGKSRWVL